MAPSRRRFVLAAAGVVSVPLAVACNGLVGISDYDKVECNGGGICVDSGLIDGPFIDAGPDAPDGSKVDGAVGADPVSWARWRMPNYTLPDASLPNPPALAIAGDEVQDGITGLAWRKALEGGSSLVKLEGAQTACRNIAPAGTWRVPKRIELVTLLDYGHEKPFISPVSFPGFAPVRVWSSSEVRPFTGGANQAYWSVNFDTGVVEAQNGGQTAAATLCVKAK